MPGSARPHHGADQSCGTGLDQELCRGTLAAIGSGFALGLNESWRLAGVMAASLSAVAALFVALGTDLMIHAFRGVEISIVAPFRYRPVAWGGIAGCPAFGEVPDGWTGFGAALIVARGLSMLRRDAVRRCLSLAPPAARRWAGNDRNMRRNYARDRCVRVLHAANLRRRHARRSEYCA